jgi:hypothetical protein
MRLKERAEIVGLLFRRYSSTFLSFVFLVGCSRETQVTGVVTNAFTGKPIPGLSISLFAYNGNEPRDSANPKKVGEAQTTTNTNGEYTLTYNGKGIDKVGLLVGGGYNVTHFDLQYSESPEPNHCTENNIVVDQITGFVDVELDHQFSPVDSLYFRVDCDILNEKGTACCNRSFENKLATGETRTVKIPVTAGRYVYIYSSPTRFRNWDTPRVDSVFCDPDKTTLFKLVY